LYILPLPDPPDNPDSCRIRVVSAIIAEADDIDGPPMHPTCRLLLLSALLSTSAPSCLGAAPADEPANLDEVTVNGERVKLDALREQIVQLEDQFYDRYNELNPIADFDVHCIEEARTGTRLIKRSCRAVYQEKALAEEGQAAFKVIQQMRNTQRSESGPPVSATLVIQERLPEFQKNLEEVTRKHPELAGLLEKRGKLIEKYEAAQKMR
jgi:hypothetical protein